MVMPNQEQIASTAEQVSKVEPVSQTVEPVKEPAKEPQVTPQTLTEERIQQMIAEATQRATEQGKELGKREMQAIKDREVADAQKKVRLAEQRAKTYEESFNGLDEETRQGIELKKLRSENQFYQSAEQQEIQRQQQEAYTQKLNETLVGNLKRLKIDPEDKRIDWARDASDYLTGRSRFDDSVAKIIEEKQRAAEDKVASSFKELELKMRRDLELDSVDTTTSGGVPTDGLPTNPAKLREWIANATQAEFEKHAPKLNELRRQGKI